MACLCSDCKAHVSLIKLNFFVRLFCSLLYYILIYCSHIDLKININNFTILSSCTAGCSVNNVARAIYYRTTVCNHPTNNVNNFFVLYKQKQFLILYLQCNIYNIFSFFLFIYFHKRYILTPPPLLCPILNYVDSHRSA